MAARHTLAAGGGLMALRPVLSLVPEARRHLHICAPGPGDVPGIVTLGKIALRDQPIPDLEVNTDKLFSVAMGIVCSQHQKGRPCGWARIAKRNGQVVAALLASVDEMAFYTGGEATVVQLFTLEPGAGLPLLRRFLEWCHRDPWIRAVSFSPDTRVHERVGKVLQRLGFEHQTTIYTRVRTTS